jgi:acyl-CoA:acyl-CoA alkyltransferase
LMRTDAERLLEAGIATGAETFTAFLAEAGWDPAEIDRTFCHQIGASHRKRMLDALGLDLVRDFTTLEFLGNTGSAALPITMAIAADQGVLSSGDQVAMLGIGSGINSIMIGLDWQHTLLADGAEIPTPAVAGAE